MVSERKVAKIATYVALFVELVLVILSSFVWTELGIIVGMVYVVTSLFMFPLLLKARSELAQYAEEKTTYILVHVALLIWALPLIIVVGAVWLEGIIDW